MWSTVQDVQLNKFTCGSTNHSTGVTMSAAECEYHSILTKLDAVITDEITLQW